MDASYQSVLQLHFPEDYKDAQARCRHIAQILADRHQTENILLVIMMLDAGFICRILNVMSKPSYGFSGSTWTLR